MSERKDPQLDAKHQSILKKLMQLPHNKTCADCKGASPRWASTNLGVFICIGCSGIHRKLGTHISQVRSVTLDTWTARQIEHFQTLGNARAAEIYEACLPADFRRPAVGDSAALERFIRDKYERRLYSSAGNGSASATESLPQSDYSSSNASRPATRRNANSLGSRPSNYELFSGYENEDSDYPSRPSSLSYAGQFRSRNSRTSSISNSWNSLLSGTAPGVHQSSNTVRNAQVVKALIEMGFPASVARAGAYKSKGDIQKAVEWVLAQNVNSEMDSPAIPRSEAKPVTSKHVPDLLDFSSGEPGKPGVSIVPVLKEPAKATSSTSVATNVNESATAGDNDFADFGAFESALPVSSSTTTTSASSTGVARPYPNTANPSTVGTLNAMLAQLYAKVPQNTSISENSKLEPSLLGSKPQVMNKQKNSLQSSDMNVSQTGQSAKPSFVPPESLFSVSGPFSSQQAHKSNPEGTTNISTIFHTPPPPPPLQAISNIYSDTDPPPPPPTSTPPPYTDPSELPDTLKPNQEAPDADPVPSAKEQVRDSMETEKGTDLVNGGQQFPVHSVTKEEDDPFADLAKHALSSATSKLNRSRGQTMPNLLEKDAKQAPKPISEPLSLEDLLG